MIKNIVMSYWEYFGFDKSKWNNVEFVEKDFGYIREWMDNGVSDSAIIKAIRLMYEQKVNRSTQLFGGHFEPDYYDKMRALGLPESWTNDDIYDMQITIFPLNVDELKQWSGSYLMGGGRDECLKEIQLFMNAFNIKYKIIDKFVYG